MTYEEALKIAAATVNAQKAKAQTRNNNCAQTCVAMIAGISVQQSEKIYGHGHQTKQHETIQALETLGFTVEKGVKDGFVYFPEAEKLPEHTGIIVVRVGKLRRYRGQPVKSGGTKNLGHLLVFCQGWFWDPADGQLYAQPKDGWKITHAARVWKKN